MSGIKAGRPEKLATILNQATGEWFLDKALLHRIKSPGWEGWGDNGRTP